MKRSSATKEDQESVESQNDSDGSDNDQLEPSAKRAKMPKKAKYRMRAHINPMGDLTIPVYDLYLLSIQAIKP